MSSHQHVPPRILTIAGSDSGGGAGIQADLKTITALGGFGMSAITALTAQNTCEVRDVHVPPIEFLRLQIDAVAEDIGVDAAKTGMLYSARCIRAATASVDAHDIPHLVVDPVMIAQGGSRLLEKEAGVQLQDHLFPHAELVTPNLLEAEVLSGRSVRTPEQMRDAAREIKDMGPTAVLIKGGHLKDTPVDLLYADGSFHKLEFERIDTTNTHGTGCTYSAAIATYLGAGMDIADAVGKARAALQDAIEQALPLGAGHGPLNHRAMFSEKL